MVTLSFKVALIIFPLSQTPGSSTPGDMAARSRRDTLRTVVSLSSMPRSKGVWG
jgi:hypothetical protein